MFVLNVSGKKCVMTEDTLIGIAVPGVVASGPCLVDFTSGRRSWVGSVTGQT